MPRTTDPRVTKRNQQLVEDFDRDPLLTTDQLARKHGVSAQMVHLILRRAGRVSRTDRRKRPKGADRKSVSNLHCQFGNVLEYSIHNKILDRSASPNFLMGDVAHILGMSAMRLSLLLKGQVDPTLTELLRCAQFMGVSKLGELISKCEEKVCTTCGKNAGNIGF